MLENLEGNQIELRGHHLFGAMSLVVPENFRDHWQDDVFIQLKKLGYEAKFGQRTIRFWNELSKKPDVKIKLIDSLDYFCLALVCPKKKDSCSGLDLSNQDIDVIFGLGFMPYESYSVEEIRDTLKKRIESKKVPGINF